MVLMWEAKVIAVADAALDAVADMNWKHKVNPERGDLMMIYCQLDNLQWFINQKFGQENSSQKVNIPVISLRS